MGEGDRCWPWFQRLQVWQDISGFFFGSANLRVSEQDEGKIQKCSQVIVAAHPHGIMSYNHALCMTNIAGYLDRFPQFSCDNRRDLGASVIFFMPFFRDVLLWTGCIDAGKATFIVNNADLRTVMDDVHYEVFKMTCEERKAQSFDNQLGADWSAYEKPTVFRNG